jgi:serine/threonine-protein kinase RsbW
MTAGPSFDRARLEHLGELMAFLDAECARAGVQPDAAFAIRLAAEEVFVNIVRHGYGGKPGPARVAFDRDGDRVTLTLEDEAPAFDPDDAPAPDLDADLTTRVEGGLGWHLVRKLMDDVRHRTRPGGGNVFTLVKYVGEPNED